MSLFGRRTKSEPLLEDRLEAIHDAATPAVPAGAALLEPVLDALALRWSRVEELSDVWRLESDFGEIVVSYLAEVRSVHISRIVASVSDIPPEAHEGLLHANAQAEGASFALQRLRTDRYLTLGALIPVEAFGREGLRFALHSVLERSRWLEANAEDASEASTEPSRLETELSGPPAVTIAAAEERASLESALSELSLPYERHEDPDGYWRVATDLGHVELRRRPDGGAFRAWSTLELVEGPLGEEIKDWMLEANASNAASFSLAEDSDARTWVEAANHFPSEGLGAAALAFWLEGVVRLARSWG
jgi:hypothetical protein